MTTMTMMMMMTTMMIAAGSDAIKILIPHRAIDLPSKELYSTCGKNNNNNKNIHSCPLK